VVDVPALWTGGEGYRVEERCVNELKRSVHYYFLVLIVFSSFLCLVVALHKFHSRAVKLG
jgi:hypothetical protein